MPKRRRSSFPIWKNGKLLLIGLGFVIIVHLIIFVIYTERNSSVEFKVNREIISRQIIHFIQTIRNTPIGEQEKLVNALNIPNMKITIDKAPLWNEQFINASFWHILQEISTQSPTIELSYMLAQERWLNISAMVIQKTVGLDFLLFCLEATIIIAVLFSLWTINRFTIPLKKFTEAAERLGVDLHAKPLDVLGPRVAKATAHAINKMQERIRDLIQVRTQMLAAISHDLRTPITRLKLRVQYVEDQELSQKITKDLDEMEAMISETLSFAREDNKNEKRVNFDLSSLISSLCADFSETGRNVRYNGVHAGVLFYGGPATITRVFTNLIDNAIKYGSKADVSLTQTYEEIIITVDDEGPGIPSDQMNKVFQPFYRGEHSRSRETGGTGLGLTVALDIMRAHGGNIYLINRHDGGLTAKVSLPRLSDD